MSENLRIAAETEVRAYIATHRHRIRGGVPLFPDTNRHTFVSTITGLPGAIFDDLTDARSDSRRSFGSDARGKKGNKPAEFVTLVNSLPYEPHRISGARFRYERLMAMFEGKSFYTPKAGWKLTSGNLLALCHMYDYGTETAIDPDTVYEVNKGAIFIPTKAIAFEGGSGSIEPVDLDMDEQATNEWLARMWHEEIGELEETARPSVDGYALTVGEATKQTAKSLARGAAGIAVYTFFGNSRKRGDG